jgi:peroxiredoxin
MRTAPLPLLATCLSLCIAHAQAVNAQQVNAFGQRPNRDIVVPVFADADVTRALATLDARLAAVADGEGRDARAERVYFELTRYLQTGLLTSAQQARVLAHFDRIEATRPSEAALLTRPRDVVTRFTPGKVPPNIAGTDLDGQSLTLREHRGKVVVLMFGGEWCGICKTEYPYLRLLTEVYGNWPFVILGVNSDPTPEQARQASKERGLQYRAWWDGQGVRAAEGPIARDWQVVGWPTTYVLDPDGVIRFVDLRQDDLVRGVKQLMAEVSRTLERGSR